MNVSPSQEYFLSDFTHLPSYYLHILNNSNLLLPQADGSTVIIFCFLINCFLSKKVYKFSFLCLFNNEFKLRKEEGMTYK